MRDLYPGCFVQVDTKHLQFGGRKYYQFIAVDCFSRMGYMQVLSAITSRSGSRFLEKLEEFLPFPVGSIQTDNGSEYEKESGEALKKVKIDHYFTYPNCLQQNGERKTV